MTGHPVRLGPDGRLVVVRQAPPEAPDRLRHAAERLRAAAGAGAVDLVHVVDDGERVEVALAFAGRPLSAPIAGDDLAPIATALAAHLSDLHLRGFVHGAVLAEHVLVDAHGAVRLCGLGHDGDLAPSADVHAFGALVRDVLDPVDRSTTADALRLHADRCYADEAARPTMAAIAASLASFDGGGRATPSKPRHPTTRRWPRAAVMTSTALLAALALVALPRVSRDEPRHDASSTTTTSVSTTTTSTTSAPTRVWPRSLERDGATWTLGDADDRTAVGDLDCDGVATPAVLQLPEGHVWVVGQWRDGAAATFVTTVAGATDIGVTTSDGCDVLVVRTAEDEIRLTPSA